MKLFLVHAGFYDENVSGGFYESHTNYFIVADGVKEAKKKAKEKLADQMRELAELHGVDLEKINLPANLQ